MGCAFCNCHNHSSLINNVYPSGPGEEGPKSSALSLLIFYSTSKPQKLPKIGAYLESRVEQDLRRGRFGYRSMFNHRHVKISLHIINSILNECQQHSSLISKSILRIVLAILNCPDADLVLLATNTFILFSSVRTNEENIDPEFNILHNQLIKKFCAEATRETAISVEKNKSRLSGLKALEALCDTSYFNELSHIESSMDNVFTAIFTNLDLNTKRDSGLSNHFPKMGELKPNPLDKRQSITDQLITDDELKQTAERCLISIFKKSNATTIKPLITCTNLDQLKYWENSLYVQRLVQMVAHNCETQYHYAIVSQLLDRLENEGNVMIKSTIVNVLGTLFSDGFLGGLTIPELLDTLIKHMQGVTLQQKTDLSGRRLFQTGIVSTIGNLSQNIAYPNQANEMVSFLVNRMQRDHSYGSFSPTDNELVLCLLECIGAVMEKYGNTNSSQKRSSVLPTTLSYHIFTAIVPFLESKSSEVRLVLYSIFLRAVQYVRLVSKTDQYRNEFLEMIRRNIYILALSPNNTPVDFVIFGNLLNAMTAVDFNATFGKSSSLLFNIQQKMAEAGISLSQRRALASITVELLLSFADLSSNTGLTTYMTNIKNLRLEKQQWSPGIELSEKAIPALKDRQFDDTEVTSKPLNSPDDLNIQEIKDLIKAQAEKDAPETLADMIKEWDTEYDPSTHMLIVDVGSSGEILASSFEMNAESPPPVSVVVKVTRVKSIKKQSNLPHKRSASAISSRSEKPTAVVSVADFNKDALGVATDAKAVAPQLESPKVNDLLKSITAAFGSRPASAPAKDAENGDHELEWLKTRSRAVSTQNNQSKAHRAKSPTGLVQLGKIREPTIFDLKDEDN
ncbi:Protein EFR3 B [Terramyces sp. JEL0728]|nr:Protein EFR3 B [Terramyces sp. JEL0728]